jgi:RNA polymerase sigma-70 factor, ECF subfamily
METASFAVIGSTYFGRPQDLVTGGLNELYQEYSATVFKTALRVTGNAADAEDVLQTVFVRILDHQVVLNPACSPERYLRRAAINASIDLLRRKAARSEHEFEDDRQYASREDSVLLKERLRRAVAKQPAENAELFVMCYVEGYSYDELAEHYQLERGTVASRLHRIRAAIRKDLGE